jgi:hypothetical protein
MNPLQIPLPTDSLYKFIALSGIAIVFATAYFGIKIEEASRGKINTRIPASVIIMLATAMATVGFHLWYTKIQKYQDIIIQKQAEELQKNANQTK